MNRRDLVHEILYWEALANEAKSRAQANRAELDAAAREEFANEGTSPTWRTPLGTVSLSVSEPDVIVEDRDAWTEWVGRRHPTEVVVTASVRPEFERAYLRSLEATDPPSTEDGEIIPGVKYIPGGRPRWIALKASAEVRADFASIAKSVVDSRLALDSVKEQ